MTTAGVLAAWGVGPIELPAPVRDSARCGTSLDGVGAALGAQCGATPPRRRSRWPPRSVARRRPR